MTAKTHLAGGVLAGLVASSYLAAISAPTQYIPIVLTAAAGGLFPDIDCMTSKMGQSVKPVSFLVQKIFGHRTLFHAPLLYLILLTLSNALWQDNFLLNTVFIAGCFSHLLLDMLNSKGIPIFYPIGKKIHIACFSLNGIFEKLISLMLLLAIASFLFKGVIKL